MKFTLQIQFLCLINRHLPRGRCGLKSSTVSILSSAQRHLPRGRCGLKSSIRKTGGYQKPSPSARKVWIEINVNQNLCNGFASPSARKVWIEITSLSLFSVYLSSPSARKVWIEIRSCFCRLLGDILSPSARKVWIEIRKTLPDCQMLRSHLPRGRCGLKYQLLELRLTHPVSPSARKVWIEIMNPNYK